MSQLTSHSLRIFKMGNCLRQSLFLFFLPFLHAWDPSNPLPSCLSSNLTWEQSNIFDVELNCKSADECQSICATTEGCVGFTWQSADAQVFPLGCGLFADTGAELPCDHCVSGVRECPCTVKGECDSKDDNMIEVSKYITRYLSQHYVCPGTPTSTHS